MGFKTRYRFWQVLLGFVGLAILAAIFYFFVYKGSTVERNHSAPGPNENPESSLRFLHDFLYCMVLFYFSLNYYYNLVINASFRLLSCRPQ